MRGGLIIARMVIDMNETRLHTIEQIEQFLSANAPIEFSAAGDDSERYRYISRVLKRFDYPGRNKRERGVLLKYLRLQPGDLPLLFWVSGLPRCLDRRRDA